MEGAVTVSSLMGSIGDIFTAAIGWVGDVASTVTDKPILLLFAIVPCVCLAIGLFRRLLNVQ